MLQDQKLSALVDVIQFVKGACRRDDVLDRAFLMQKYGLEMLEETNELVLALLKQGMISTVTAKCLEAHLLGKPHPKLSTLAEETEKGELAEDELIMAQWESVYKAYSAGYQLVGLLTSLPLSQFASKFS